MRNYIAEVIGTFILIFIGTGSVVVNVTNDGVVSLVGVALAWGLAVAVVVYTVGDVSGAHINPAVTIGLCVAKRFDAKLVAPYILCQCIGAFLASGLIRVMFPDALALGHTEPAGTLMQSFVMEIVLTMILMFVVLNLGVGAKEKGITAGLVVGGVITFEVLVGGPISGASMNPARSIAPAVVGGHLQHLWIYLTAPVIGAIVAVGLYACIRPLNSAEEATES